MEGGEESNIETPIPDEVDADNIEEMEDMLFNLRGLDEQESDEEDSEEETLDELDE